MTTSDHDLLVRAVKGDEKSLSSLLKRYGPSVRARLNGKIADTWRSVLDEDDVMQVTYLEAFLRVSQLRASHPSEFSAWLTRIALNNLRDALKELRRAKRPQPNRRIDKVRVEDTYETLLDVVSSTMTSVSKRLQREELHAMLDAAIKKLPPDYAKVLRAYDLDGRPAAEVAKLLGKSEGAMYMLRARAHERLRSVLGTTSKFFTGSP
jgi:RNA polymerase sigma-70 factor (ECF subfamily)